MSGRPRIIEVTTEEVVELRRHPDRLTWEEIARRLKCGRSTVIRLWKQGQPKGRKKKGIAA